MEPVRTILKDTLSTSKLMELFDKNPIEQRVGFLREGLGVNTKGEIVSVYEDDEKICYGVMDAVICLNNKLYIKRNIRHGFTFNKKTKKISSWAGTNVNVLIKGGDINIYGFFRHLKLDWFMDMHPNLQRLITKTVLENILSGKITNPESYIKKCISVSFKTNKLYWKLFRECIVNSNIRNSDIQRYIKHTTNPNEAIKIIMSLKENTDAFGWGDISEEKRKITHHYNLLIDTISDAEVLGVKINPLWSVKRLTMEHNKMQKEINSYLIKPKSTEIINYSDKEKLPLLKNMTLLDNEFDVYMEGKNMHHCIYTNYWREIQKKKYFCIKMDLPERCTIGIIYDIKKDCFIIQQMYLERNNITNTKTNILVKTWLEQEKVQKFFRQNWNGTLKDYSQQNMEEMEEMEEMELLPLPF